MTAAWRRRDLTHAERRMRTAYQEQHALLDAAFCRWGLAPDPERILNYRF